jgi:hypothetical protein
VSVVGTFAPSTDVRSTAAFGGDRTSASGRPRTEFGPPAVICKHSRDLPIAALVTDRAMEAWYHLSIA